jgi:hypothetical protein
MGRHVKGINEVYYFLGCSNKDMQLTNKKQIAIRLLSPCILLVNWLAYLFTLKAEAIHFCETSLNFYQTTWYHIPEDSNLHSHYC